MTDAFDSAEPDALTDEFLARLRARLEEARVDAAIKQTAASTATRYVAKIEAAVRSIEALQATEVRIVTQPPRELSDADYDLLAHFGASEVKADAGRPYDDPPPPKLAPYVPNGGKRLKSKRMIFDLAKQFDAPLTREQLKDFFFEHYGREDLQRYWVRPDNALNTAIDRAIADGYLLTVPVRRADGALGDEIRYTSGFEDGETGGPASSDEEDD